MAKTKEEQDKFKRDYLATIAGDQPEEGAGATPGTLTAEEAKQREANAPPPGYLQGASPFQTITQTLRHPIASGLASKAEQGLKETASSPLSFYSAPQRFATALGHKGADISQRGAGIVARKFGYGDTEPGKPSAGPGNVEGAFPTLGGGSEKQAAPYGGISLVGGGGVIPAHEGRTVSPRIENMLEGASEGQKQAVVSGEAANIHAIQMQQENAERQAAIYQHLVDQQNQQEAQRRNVLNNHMESQQALMDDIRSFKVDPNRIYNDAGIGGFKKVSSIIAVALGGLGGSLQGTGGNVAADIINRTIDRDIDAQKTELEKKKGLLQESNSLFAQKMQQFGDERAAAAATKQDVLAGAMATAEAAMGSARTEQERAKAEGLLSNLQGEWAKQQAVLHPWVQQQVTGVDYRKIYADKYAEAIQKGGDEKAADAFAAGYVSRLQGKPISTGAGGLGGSKGKKGLPGGVITQISSVDSAIQALDDEIALTKDKSISLADKRARSKKNLDILSLEIPHAFTGGVPTPEQQKETRENLPSEQGTLSFQNISPIGAPDRLKQLQSQKQQLMHKRQALLATSDVERKVGSSGEGPAEE